MMPQHLRKWHLAAGSLTHEIMQQDEKEVKRLDQNKAPKMKELFLQKQTELEDICRRSYMEKVGAIDHTDIIKSMERRILRAKREASNRKHILKKVEKWMELCSEERWLEEYNRVDEYQSLECLQDENRYSICRGAHKNLKRAEHARIIIKKIPDLLVTEINSWEKEEKKVFYYDEIF
ncbi:hypothetical protein Taro_050011 [Colocasia esculenta]|uniref:Uncharacterized protein n=1 Tax=Colocasia esculenta TaxID=4460 RepID=A0A843XCC2_COLES|nr:hypothetical protein [Colocasia esculenta]